jgi:hypothetical protein
MQKRAVNRENQYFFLAREVLRELAASGARLAAIMAAPERRDAAVGTAAASNMPASARCSHRVMSERRADLGTRIASAAPFVAQGRA